MAGLTTTINRTFVRLAAQGPLDMPPQALRTALTREEYCTVRPRSRRCNTSGDNNHATLLSERCWKNDGCGAATQLGMRERGSMTRRYDIYGDGDLSRPVSSSQLGADGGPWPELLFMGDSVMAQIASYGVACELSRARQDTRVRVKFKELQRGRGGSLALALLPLHARQRGVVVVSIGLHFDNVGNAATSKGTRAEFNTAVEQIFLALDRLLHACARCGALFLTATSQHFATVDGAYAAPKVADADAPVTSEATAPAYGCRALPTSLASESSPQRWREEDVMRIAARYPRVAVAPLTTLSRSWWDMHIGASSHSWRGVAYAGANVSAGASKARVDCTHFCYSLFLWEPVWWALRLVVRATAEAMRREV